MWIYRCDMDPFLRFLVFAGRWVLVRPMGLVSNGQVKFQVEFDDYPRPQVAFPNRPIQSRQLLSDCVTLKGTTQFQLE